MKQGVQRVLTALVGIPVFLGALWLGGWVFLVLIGVIALAAQAEMIKLIRADGTNADLWVSLLAGGAVFVRFLAPEGWMVALLAISLVLGWTLRKPVSDAVGRISGGLASLIYPVLLISLVVDIRWQAHEAWGQTDGFLLTLLLIVLIWATDSGAYYTGKSIGKRPFSPSISPNKTWEGTLGGLLLGTLVAVGFKYWLLPMLTWSDVFVLAAIGGFWGQLGDLLESSLKRSAGVKDSGNFLPGHGGALDRFDSLIFSAPLYWAWLTYFSNLL
ncbi:MAG: phosphatidate cytidylyltransferase [Rhodothermales bacterium]